MGSIEDACKALIAQLKAAGFTADVDPDLLTVDTAAVWVQPRTVRDFIHGGGGSLVCWLYLIVPNVDTWHALRLLDDMLAGVLPLVAVDASDPTVDLAAAVVLPANPSTPLPAYRVAVDLDL